MVKEFKTWGERLFPTPVNGRKGRAFKTLAGTRPNPLAKSMGQGGAVKPSAEASLARAKETARKLVKKTPEVMVKVSGNSKSMAKLTSHVDYISRNGKVEIEDQDGGTYSGKSAASGILEDWKDAQGIPQTDAEAEEQGSPRQSLNIVLSMPAGTDRDALKNAARSFAEEAFFGHQWFMAEHRDTEQPHVHICVKIADEYGHRLNPRKDDLQLWREKFAEKLGEYGVEANATKRQARGKIRKSQSQAQYHSTKEKRPLKYNQNRRRETADAIRFGKSIEDAPTLAKAKQTRDDVLKNAQGFADELRGQGEHSLANGLDKHFKSLPPVESEQQMAVRLYRDRKNQTQKSVGKGKDKSDEGER